MKSKSKFLFSFFLLLLLPTALIFAAPPVKTLIGIPGITDQDLSFGSYINALYSLSISIAALLAVIKIIIAGMKYMLSDVVTTKGDAIKDIRGALLGLLIVISAVLILKVINPQLTETTIFFDPVTSKPGSFTGNSPGASKSIPLPPPPAIQRDAEFTCESSTNCDSVAASCQIRGGVPKPGSSNDKVICSFGTEKKIECKPDGTKPDNMEEYIYNCTEAKQQCYAEKGTVFEGSADSNIKCLVPYKK